MHAMLHRIYRVQDVAAGLAEVWEYFSNPVNLNALTPENMDFEIVRNDFERMVQGQLIGYRVRFMPLLRSRWLTEIAHVREPEYFVDEQRLGPYTFWYHEHLFESIPGGTRITDRVTYELPFGLLGNLVHAVWVGPRLKSIFDYRQTIVKNLFGSQDPDKKI